MNKIALAAALTLSAWAAFTQRLNRSAICINAVWHSVRVFWDEDLLRYIMGSRSRTL
jgi:hypothetical protein